MRTKIRLNWQGFGFILQPKCLKTYKKPSRVADGDPRLKNFMPCQQNLFFYSISSYLIHKKMARSHHRKKHKQHLQQFKHSQEIGADKLKSKSSATWVFGIAGAILGFAVSYFASGAIVWVAAGLIVGTAAGYFIGKKIDGQKTN
jgi:hypothetical protein